MKKIILLLLVLIAFYSFAVAKGQDDQNANCPSVNGFIIVMDRDGFVTKICWDKNTIYMGPSSSQDKIMVVDPFSVRVEKPESDLPKVLRAGLSVGTRVTITINDIGKNDKFSIAVFPQQTKYELIPIFTGKTELAAAGPPAAIAAAPLQSCSFFLDKEGTTYQIKVTRITGGKAPTPAASESEKNDEKGTKDQIKVNHITTGQPSTSTASESEKYSKNNIVSINDSASADQSAPTEKVIFAESLHTEARYHFGSHIGIFIPLRKSPQYNLTYIPTTDDNPPNDHDAVITEHNSLKATMVFIASWYPFGFEPEAKFFSCGRIQLNLGAELSSSIFKRIYFGPGYAFKWFSINFLFRYGETQELQKGFVVNDTIISDGMQYQSPVPTVSKNRMDWGVTFCLPADFLMSWLGKSLGLK